MNQVQKGKKKLYACALPSFLYPEGTVFDERYPDKDLFRGHVMIRVCSLFAIIYITQ